MDTSETVFLPSDRDASGRSLGEEELQLLREVIEGGNLFCVPGNMVPRFERAFAELYGVPHARAARTDLKQGSSITQGDKQGPAAYSRSRMHRFLPSFCARQRGRRLDQSLI